MMMRWQMRAFVGSVTRRGKIMNRRRTLSTCSAPQPFPTQVAKPSLDGGSAVEPKSSTCTTPTNEGPRAGFFPNFVVMDQDGTKARFYEDLLPQDRSV